jgi:prephenate dehydratase
MFYVDVTYQNLTRYRQSIDAIVPLTKELQILGEYTKSEIAGNR